MRDGSAAIELDFLQKLFYFILSSILAASVEQGQRQLVLEKEKTGSHAMGIAAIQKLEDENFRSAICGRA